MILRWPSVAAERWIEAAARLGLAPASPAIAPRLEGWRTVGLVTRAALGLRGVAAAGLTAGLVSVLSMPRPALVTGLLAVGAAEWLIAKHRLTRAGIEEGLFVCGALALAYEIYRLAGDPARAEWLLLAGALLLAGLRLLNPLFTTAAALAAVAAIHQGTAAGSPPDLARGGTCLAIGALALAGGALRFERPSLDRLLDWLVIAMPVAAYVWLSSGTLDGPGVDYRHAAGWRPWCVPLLPFAYGIAALATGLRRRAHAPLLAAMLCAACVGVELRRLSGWALETRLVVWGTLLLVAAVALERSLRTPRRGIVSTRLGPDAGHARLLDLAGAAALTPGQPAAPPGPGFRGGGGGFAGGGASGDWDR